MTNNIVRDIPKPFLERALCYCYILRPFGLSLDFASYENLEAVHPETRVPVSTRVLPKYLDHG